MSSSSKNERVRVSKTSTVVVLPQIMATRHLQKHFWLILCLPPCSHTHTDTHTTHTPHTTSPRPNTNTNTTHNSHTTHATCTHTTQHTTTHTTPRTRQPTVILRVFWERSDMCSPVNRLWSRECLRQEKWMLGNVHSGQPIVILRVSSTWMLGYVLVKQPTVILRRKSGCLDMRLSDNRPWSCQVPFLFKTVTSVTSVIFLRILLFSNYYHIVFELLSICNVCNLMQTYCFRFYFRSVSVIISSGMVPVSDNCIHLQQCFVLQTSDLMSTLVWRFSVWTGGNEHVRQFAPSFHFFVRHIRAHAKVAGPFRKLILFFHTNWCFSGFFLLMPPFPSLLSMLGARRSRLHVPFAFLRMSCLKMDASPLVRFSFSTTGCKCGTTSWWSRIHHCAESSGSRHVFERSNLTGFRSRLAGAQFWCRECRQS